MDLFNGGFKRDSVTSDNLFVLLGSIEKSYALKQPYYVCFVDFKCAFDSVNSDLLFFQSINTGFDGKAVTLFRNLYNKKHK